MMTSVRSAIHKLDIKNVGRLPHLGRELSAGAVAALSILTNCFAYGILIFSGPLHSFLGEGVAAALITCATCALFVALLSRFPAAIAGPIANTSALLVVVMTSLTPVMETLAPNQRLALAYTALFVATVAPAAALLLVGFIRAGKLVRFVPYPVIAGFMGATGWLVVAGAVKMTTDVPIGFQLFVGLAQPQKAPVFAALLTWSAILWVATKKIKHPLTLPIALVLASLTVDLLLLALGISTKEAQTQGILFSVSSAAWPGIPALSGQYFQVDWKTLLPAGGAIGAITLVTVMQTLFLASGLEISTRTEVDLDDELRTLGWANLASAALGGFVGQVTLSATSANRSAGGTSRITGIVVSLIALLSLLGAGSALEFIPRFILGGVLLVQGLRLLQEWTIATYRTLPRLEWLLVVGIVVITAWLGFVPAEVGGLIAACVLFALSVSRVEVVRTVSGLNARTSTVVRPEEETQILAEHGACVQVMDLRGFVFFGSAYSLREKVKAVVAEHRPLMLIFDFSRVVGIDSSAASAMIGVSRLLADSHVQQVIVGLSAAAVHALRTSGAVDKNAVLLDRIDEALERGENAVLAAHASDLITGPAFPDWLGMVLGSTEDAATLQQHLVHARYKAGEFLCRHGDPTDDLYFLEQGRVSAIVERGVSTPTRVRVFNPHTLIGEIAFVLSVPRTASLRVDEDAVVWSLNRSSFDKLSATHTDLVLALLRNVLRFQAERLAFATRQIAALQS